MTESQSLPFAPLKRPNDTLLREGREAVYPSRHMDPNFGLNADVTEFGNLPNPGKRTDLDRLAEAVKNGQSMRDVADLDPATYIRNSKRSLRRAKDIYENHLLVEKKGNTMSMNPQPTICNRSNKSQATKK